LRVYYSGRRGTSRVRTPQEDGDVLELLWDNWDDFGYKTTFVTACRIGGGIIELGLVRLLIEGHTTSYATLNQLMEDGWDGTFPPPGINFISVPQEITFYQQLKPHLGNEATVEVARTLRDASLLVRTYEERHALDLVATDGFKHSLQRESGSRTAFKDGWKILENLALSVEDVFFTFVDVFGNHSALKLNFDAEALLPHDINVLIGPNGVGKSQLLHQMVNGWIMPTNEGPGFDPHPNLSQIIVVSYNPFERFPVDMQTFHVQDKDVYRYFGFRGRSEESERIRLSHQFPKRNAAESLIACLAGDQKYKFIADWARKVSTVESVLKHAFEFDFAAIEIDPKKRVKLFYEDADAVVDGPISLAVNEKRYLPIATHTMDQAIVHKIAEACIVKSGVSFFKDGAPIELSSGQRLFAYIVIDLVGAIRRNSLILIDEPELFLHPTLEIQFIEMLKEILTSYNSKALLATHSEVTVREVPADCVHVLARTEDGLRISNPPFQTFGGDIQRISSYVFGDNVVSKPFERWVQRKLREYGSADALIEALGDNLNEELLIQIKSL